MLEERLPVSSKSAAGLARKRSMHQLPPQKCPRCKADLSDPDVPERYVGYKTMFGRAVEVPLTVTKWCWRCPDCGLQFGKHTHT